MKYPTLTELNTYREVIDVFKGYNHNLRIGDGEFYDMKNLSSDNYPVLSPRQARGVYASPGSPMGMVAKDALCYVDGKDFVMNEYRVDMGLDDKPKTLISMGAYVIIMPDKKYINTKSPSDWGNIEASVKTSGTVSFTPCKADGSDYENTVISSTAPSVKDAEGNTLANIPIWIDTSSTPHSYKQYSVSNAMWSTIPTIYIRISYAGIGLPFEVNDGVTISGVEGIDDLSSPTSTVIWAKDEQNNWIVVKGLIDKLTEQTTPITVERRMPNMDYVIESGNRLWGCRYGPARNGEIVNEIYASKLGDFKNWECFPGVSTDSYYAQVGTDGQFTGAIAHLGYPIFFKENCMHKVYGNYPANFQVQATTCRGVQMGCEKSLAIVNEVLYYKSRTGVCAYDGSLPVEISTALGDISYNNAVAGALGNKYYISMSDANEQWHLFVYDTVKGMWHREDDTQAEEFCNCRGDLYYIDHNYKQIKTVRGSGTPEASTIKWTAETGIIGTDSPDKKYISRMDVRLSLTSGSRVFFYIQYDSTSEWEHLLTMIGTTLRSFSIPIRPKRCDHLRLRIIGEGDAKIYSIYKTIEQGSDI